jgi:hypothetical protein
MNVEGLLAPANTGTARQTLAEGPTGLIYVPSKNVWTNLVALSRNDAVDRSHRGDLAVALESQIVLE